MKKIGIFIAVLVLILAGVKVWWENGMRPVNTADTSETMFLIRKGAGMREIANDLKEQGLIRDSVVFFLHVRQNNLDSKIQIFFIINRTRVSGSDVESLLLRSDYTRFDCKRKSCKF